MKIKRLVDGLPAPKRQHVDSAGYDLCSAVGKFTLQPGQRKMIETGFAWEIPQGMVGMVRPRSGLAWRNGVHTLAGVIDADYRGEVKVILINLSNAPKVIEPGERIAQMVVQSFHGPELIEVDELSDTTRGEGGIGSTG